MIVVRKSDIHGKGVFATIPLRTGVFITNLTHYYPVISEFGKKFNHSYTPNAEVRFRPGTYGSTQDVYSIRDIEPGEEITLNYNDLSWHWKPAKIDWA